MDRIQSTKAKPEANSSSMAEITPPTAPAAPVPPVPPVPATGTKAKAKASEGKDSSNCETRSLLREKKIVAVAVAVALVKEACANSGRNSKVSGAARPGRLLAVQKGFLASAASAVGFCQALLFVETGISAEDLVEMDLRRLCERDRGGLEVFVAALGDLVMRSHDAGGRAMIVATAAIDANAALVARVMLRAARTSFQVLLKAEVGLEHGTVNSYFCFRIVEAALARVEGTSGHTRVAREALAEIAQLLVVCGADERLKLPYVYSMHLARAAGGFKEIQG